MENDETGPRSLMERDRARAQLLGELAELAGRGPHERLLARQERALAIVYENEAAYLATRLTEGERKRSVS